MIQDQMKNQRLLQTKEDMITMNPVTKAIQEVESIHIIRPRIANPGIIINIQAQVE
jgi:hypothetical protein